MTRFFILWNSAENESLKRADKVSKFLLNTNENFKLFLTNVSWFVYAFAGLLILCCIYYYFYDCKRRMELRRRRAEVQRASERIPQRRRPGAVYRDHEIFRNVMKTVRQYIGPEKTTTSTNVESKPSVKPYVLRRTRSGAIYGRFPDRDNITT